MTKTQFSPDTPITRAQFVTMLMQGLGIQSQENDDAFKDIQAGDWFYSSVKSAKELGIISGNQNGLFNPHANISRQEIAVILNNTLNIMGYTQTQGTIDVVPQEIDVVSSATYKQEPQPETITSNSVSKNNSIFIDVDAISSWSKNAVEVVSTAGIISGYPDKTFRPSQNTTRAEASSVLVKLFKHIEFLY